MFVAAHSGVGLRFFSDTPVLSASLPRFLFAKPDLLKSATWGNAWHPFWKAANQLFSTHFKHTAGMRRHPMSTKKSQECVSQTSSLASQCPFSMWLWSVASVFFKVHEKAELLGVSAEHLQELPFASPRATLFCLLFSSFVCAFSVTF